MAQVTIYVPDWLHGRVKAAGLNVSRICQDALRAKLDLPSDLLEPPSPVPLTPVDCTAELGPDPARAGFTVRHIGNKVRHRWGSTCSACGGNWG